MGTGSSVGGNGGSGTGNSVSVPASASGIMLPAPKVQMYHPTVPSDIFAALGSPSVGTSVQLAIVRYVKVTVPGIPHEILKNIAKYQPQVELLRFTRLNGRDSQSPASAGNGTRSSAYVHPSHGPAASGNGSFTHGGAHGGVDPAIQALRPTEWPVLTGGDAIDVTQGIAGFMCLFPIEYRDSAGASVMIEALVPTSSLGRRARPGRRFPYQRIFSPGYFEFRLSVVDLSDPRGKRIHGPHSLRVSATNNIFPFLPAGLDAGGKAQATIDPRFDQKTANFWLGSTSRLPAQ